MVEYELMCYITLTKYMIISIDAQRINKTDIEKKTYLNIIKANI
jgi:hypothetical protein